MRKETLLTFTSLFSRPSIKCISNNRLEPKTLSFAQLITQNSSFPLTYSNHQSQYGCARLNEKMWVVHCREQLIKAVNDELKQTTKEEVSHSLSKSSPKRYRPSSRLSFFFGGYHIFYKRK